ncbi:hypothetical protein [Rhizobium oryziradicis]|uniref:Uncharacterized protein n=1 Tax=Rhizobium oryziradicis TaxID=1867956 RepID=A0A1Q8ZQ19_9HYPH|nr:hypothetical protein [Rhizobium oryziradicis]OLP44157.1 hypothetical protein BJF95_06230 [Rhizobium oryziradicis]
MDEKQQKEAEEAGKSFLRGLVVFVLFIGFIAFAVWPKSDGKTRAQRAAELEAWTQKRNAEKAVRESNKIIYEEMLRQGVRSSN